MFVKFVPPMIMDFVLQTQSRMPLIMKNMTKENKLCGKTGIKVNCYKVEVTNGAVSFFPMNFVFSLLSLF